MCIMALNMTSDFIAETSNIHSAVSNIMKLNSGMKLRSMSLKYVVELDAVDAAFKKDFSTVDIMQEQFYSNIFSQQTSRK